jgi:hypothetical protein
VFDRIWGLSTAHSIGRPNSTARWQHKYLTAPSNSLSHIIYTTLWNNSSVWFQTFTSYPSCETINLLHPLILEKIIIHEIAGITICLNQRKKNEFTSYNISIHVGIPKHWTKASGSVKMFKYTTLLSYVIFHIWKRWNIYIDNIIAVF